jgi:hypothetical protein
MLTFLGLGCFGTPNLPKKVFFFNPLIDFKKGVLFPFIILDSGEESC